jgi:hypothetical protein
LSKRSNKRELALKTNRQLTPAKAAPTSITNRTIIDDGKIAPDPYAGRLAEIRANARHQMDSLTKTAGIFDDGGLGPSNIADSNNIGYYNFEFPVDAMEMPQSRTEEIRFYNLAYDRDPIVGQAIDLHTEIPLSKMTLEKPKCSVDKFSDYVFDFFQRMVNDTGFYTAWIVATREQAMFGESFVWCEQPSSFDAMKLGEVATKAREKGRGFQAGLSPATESENAPLIGQEQAIAGGYGEVRRKHSAIMKQARKSGLFNELDEQGIEFDEDEDLDDLQRVIVKTRKKLAIATKVSSLIVRDGSQGPSLNSLTITAAPEDTATPAGDAPVDATPSDTPPDTDAPDDLGGGDGAMGDDLGGDSGGFAGGGSFGGGGFGDDMGIDGGGGGEMSPLATADEAVRQGEISDLKRYLHLLQRKKELLEELNNVVETKRQEREIFGHLTNDSYEGLEKIKTLPIDQISIEPGGISGGAAIMYKPSEAEKQNYLDHPETPAEVVAELEDSGTIELNQDPFHGSYVIHFARKKADYELHGRSLLQRCMRSIIYREKLRQVQTSLASRNMTPKSLITAPGVDVSQLAQLRSQVDEMKSDPDFSLITNYEVNWQEIGSEGRLLQLEGEWQHTNSDLAIGLGFSPEILIGEGMYGGNRIQLEILNNTYTQFRETLTTLIENSIFKPISMMKGFYEMDDYKRPRWIYPKVTFGRMGLRDSGDTYEMMMNLYSRGSLPVSLILEFLNIDAETVKRQLEDDLFTVNDSKFNEGLSAIYGQLAQTVVEKSNVTARFMEGLNLKDKEFEDKGLEGSGDGM